MKFFTKEWFAGDLLDEEMDRRVQEYQKYVDTLYEKVPFVFKLLLKHINLHDAIIDVIESDAEHQCVRWRGLCGDLDTGYFDLTLTYLGVTSDHSKLQLFNGQKMEILSDEIEDLENGRFTHRLLTASKMEIELQFSEIQIQVVTAKDLNRKRLCRVTSCDLVE